MIADSAQRLQQALLQAEYGHRIFPAIPGGKRPLASGWQQQATTDPEAIREMLEQHPAANLAVATGSGSDLLVIDVDLGRVNGFRSLADASPDGLGVDGIEAPRVRTPSGGCHLYFLQPAQKLTTGANAETGVDFRSNGGLVIAPPSTTGAGVYVWEVELDEAPKTHCPDWLLQFITGGTSAAPPAAESGLRLTVQQDLLTHPGSGEGGRNSMLCKLAGAALASGVGPEELLQQALTWNRRCSPPMQKQEVERTVLALLNSEFLKLRQGPTKAPEKPARKQVQLISRRAADVQEEALRWLWQNRFLIGHVNLLAGDPGVGKSMIAVDAAARVSTGRPWPDGSPCEQGEVLYATTEDGFADTVLPRLKAAEADCSRITFVEGTRDSDGDGALFLDEHSALLDEALQQKQGEVRLLILDTLQSFIGASISTNNNSSTRRVMTPLKQLAEKHRVAIICLEHLNKSGTPRNATYRVQGSIAFTGAARAVWIVCKDPDDESRRIVQAGKCNLAPDADGLGMAYCIEGKAGRPRIEWQEFNIATPLGELMSDDRPRGDADGGEFARAVDWLQSNLTEATPATVMDEGAKTEGISKATLRRAKGHLGISSRKTAEGWLWIPGPSLTLGEVVIADPMQPAQGGKVLIPNA